MNETTDSSSPKGSPGEKEMRERLASDFPFYAETNLKIKDKDGNIIPFVMNRAQYVLHDECERQLADRGFVRILLLKARQWGGSTYVLGRNYWKTTQTTGKRAHTLSHAQDTSDKLFSIVKLFHDEGLPELTPHTSAASAKEYKFDRLNSSFDIATAGTVETGRGGTVQLLHGSEKAFWPHAETHKAGIMQAVPSGRNIKGTEIILETTANGLGGDYFEEWTKASKGIGDYVCVFVPWFWVEDYWREVEEGYEFSNEDLEYGELYDLVPEQLRWMVGKRDELGSWRFKQEYPANAIEAFQTSGGEGLIKPKWVQQARILKPELKDFGPIVGGLDPAGDNDDPEKGDRSAFCVRQGRRVHRMQSYRGKDTMQLAGMVAEDIEEWGIQRYFIGTTGLGVGIYDRLKELGWTVENGGRGIVVRVIEGGSATDEVYLNKRAEMWWRGAKWLEDGDVEIPNLDSFQRDLITPMRVQNSYGKLQLESNELISKRIGSPDEATAFVLTFSELIADISPEIRRARESGRFSGGAPIAESSYDILEFSS